MQLCGRAIAPIIQLYTPGQMETTPFAAMEQGLRHFCLGRAKGDGFKGALIAAADN